MIFLVAFFVCFIQTQDYGPAQKAFPGDVEIHQFCWEPAPTSDWCYPKAAKYGEPWETLDMIPASNPCWTFDARNDLEPGLVFLVVTCGNIYGESVTEHGAYPGDMSDE